MKWSYHLATIKGTEVRIHATFALLLAFVAWQATSLGGGWRDALESIVLVCTMFFCVLLHEFGHVFAARRYGILTPDITLLPIGGIARLERMPRKPSEELFVALCGPLVNVVIAVLIAVGLGLPFSFDPNMQMSKVTEFWATLMQWNVLMVIFNGFNINPESVPRLLRWMPRVSLIRWAFEGMAVNEFKGLTFDAPSNARLRAMGAYTATGERALENLSFGKSTVRGAALAQGAIIGGCWVGSLHALRTNRPRMAQMRAPRAALAASNKAQKKAS
jgi:Zn-dependent protease